MTVLEYVQVVESGLQVLNWPDSFSVELGFWIPIVRGFRVPWAQDSGFHKKKFPDSGIRIPLHGATFVLSVNAKKVERLPGCE